MTTLNCRDKLDEIKSLLYGIVIITKAEVEDFKSHTDAIFMVMRCLTERLNAVDAHLATLVTKEQHRPRLPSIKGGSRKSLSLVPSPLTPDTIALAE